jgi:hypothetical protein
MKDAWAAINANWGSLEYQLYLILCPINEMDAHEWMLDFFSNEKGKKERVMRELRVQTAGDPNWANSLETALKKLGAAQTLRNVLVHGIWLRDTNGRVKVQPLRLTKRGSYSIAEEINVNYALLARLMKTMNSALQHLAHIGGEFAAYSFLEKMRRRRSRAASAKAAS